MSERRRAGPSARVACRGLVAVLAALLLAAACSAPERETAPSEAAGQSAVDGCALGADRVIDRFDEFVAELPDQTPEEFLAQEEISGLATFQTDVATIIAETTDQRSTFCNLDGFQTLIAERLVEVEPEGVLETFLVATVLRGGQLERSDVEVEPGDDVEAVLALLDDGSTVTFGAGTFDFERPLIVQRDIAFVGAGEGTTTIRSSASDAAIVVVGRGLLRTRDLSVEHVGAEQASVVVAFARPVDLGATTLRGGIADVDGNGGNGLVLTDDVFGGGERDPQQPESVIASSTLSGNAGAGLVVDGALAPAVRESVVSDNAICGVCFFGSSGGLLDDSLLEGNAFGVQVGDTATVVASGNVVSRNTVAGFVIVGEADVELVDNLVEDNAEVGAVVQEAASATIRNTTFGAQPFGLSILSSGSIRAVGNSFEGSDVGIQIDDTAAPILESNTLTSTTAVAIAHAGSSSGTSTGNVIEIAQGVGVVVEADAAPVIEELRVDGGEVGVAYASAASGLLVDAQLSRQVIGIQVDEQSVPRIERVAIDSASEAGLVVRGSAAPAVDGLRIDGFGEVGIAAADDARPTVIDATVANGVNGASFIGNSTAWLASSSFAEVDVGIQIGESARPTIDDNDVLAPASVGIVFIDDAMGEVTGNRVTDPGVVAVQFGGSSTPTLRENVFFFTRPEDAGPIGAPNANENADAVDADEGESEFGAASDETGASDASDEDAQVGETDDELGETEADVESVVGLLYADRSAGIAERNQVIGFVIGFQVGDDSAPDVVDNVVDGGVWLGVGFLYRDDAGGRAEGNRTANHGVGFQLSDRSTPIVIENEVTRVRDVALLVQGVAEPRLEKNSCPENVAGIGLLDDTDPVRIDNLCVEVLG